VTETTNCNDGSCPILCPCDDPVPGGGDHGGHCRECGLLIGGAIIDGEVHPGHTSLGNGQAFFEAKEGVHFGRPHHGTINDHDDGEWYRDFATVEVCWPHHTEGARRLGTEMLSFDHVIHHDGEVELVVQNRRVEDLPAGPKFPAQTDDIPDPGEQ
jgi:hypothetical protein